MNSINVLHLRASNFYGGPEHQLHIHAKEAQNSGFNITIASFSENGKVPEFLSIIEKDNIITHTFNVKNAYDVNAILSLKKYIRIRQYI